MPRPPVDLTRKIKDIVQHVQPLPDEATAPILHYQRTTSDIWASLAYIERAVGERDRYGAVVERHLGRLYGMALVNLVETFERFLKEAAAECVDCIANFVVDDRFNLFSIHGSALASHFGTGTLGKSLCESSTWFDCEEINKRFRRLLSDPFQDGKFYLFPKQPAAELVQFESMNLVWQIRHTSIHNVGVITQSDAVKLRLWAKENVAAPRILCPTRSDLNYLKRFMDETAKRCNQRIGDRLAELLTTIQASTPALFDAQQMANRIASAFRLALQVAGLPGMIPPD
jgi:hypothetical protein